MLCPICNRKTSRFRAHMSDHGFQQLSDAYVEIFENKAHPVCKCGNCKKKTQFISWQKGFRKFIKGHNKFKNTDEQTESSIDNSHTNKSLRKNSSLSAQINSSLRNKRKDLDQKIDLERAKQKLALHASSFELIDNIQTANNQLLFELKCKVCGNIQKKNIIYALNNSCISCDPAGSRNHIEIYRFVRGLDPDTMISCDSIIPPDNIDVYMPSYSTALEYNTLYFHSEIFKNRLYHANKTKETQKLGINLVHIFEDEWRDRQKACQYHIAMTLYKEVKFIDSLINYKFISNETKSSFLELYHIEGNVSSLCNIGAFMGEKIIAVAAFRKPKHSVYKDAIELIRFCNISDFDSSHILRNITQNACAKFNNSKIYSALDDRLGLGLLFEKADFIKTKTVEPRFWWTDGHDRLPRHKLSNSLCKIQEESFVKIWSCDISLYEYKFGGLIAPER